MSTGEQANRHEVIGQRDVSAARAMRTVPVEIVTVVTTDGVDVAIEGELDTATVPALQQALEDAVVNPGTITVDLAGVTFLNSTALNVLLRVKRSLADDSRRLRLVRPSRVARRVLELTGVPHDDDRAAT